MSALAEKQFLVRKMAAQKDGTAVTFTLTSAGTEDPEAGTFSSGSTTTVTGYASRVRGDPERYARLNLVESEAPTIDFTPDTRGDVPPLGAQVSWGGVTHVVKENDVDAVDGTANGSLTILVR